MNSRPIYVLIPALNEERTVGKVIESLKNLYSNLKIIVLDDGSNDNTAREAEKHGATVVRHIVNLGQWAALRTLFEISIREKADIIVTLDADGQHSAENLKAMIEPLLREEAELVIGSRFKDEKKPEMPKYRYYGIRFFNKLIKITTGLDISDCTSGYKAYRSEYISKLLPNLKENQYGALELIIEASKLKIRICEIPIISNSSEKTTKGNLRYAYHLIRSILSSTFDFM